MFLLRRSRSEGSRRASPCFSRASAIVVMKEGSHPIFSPSSFIVMGESSLNRAMASLPVSPNSVLFAISIA